jgi:Tfp pilus assembly protein PilN
MRPVNLIPPEERPGRRRPARSGPLAYIVVGALVAALLGVTTLVTTSNTISDRRTEITKLEDEVNTTKAKAESLSAYTQFDQVREQRLVTITSLADSRFDWERVMRELALILPGDIWLTSLDASASPEASAGNEGGSLRAGVAGPALTLSGCAAGQDAVAGFIQALNEIDGVTRVGMENSTVGEGSANSGSATAAGCEGGGNTAQFQMVVAFDAAPVPSEAAPAEAAPVTPPAEGATTSEPTSEASSESSEGEG